MNFDQLNVVSSPLSGPETVAVRQNGVTGKSTVAGILASNAPQRNILARLRACIATAMYGNNPAQLQPLIQPSAWTASTAVYAGQSFTNGGNNYTYLLAGTTASSGGPSGTGNGLITDGSATCYYMGPAYTTNANAPTYAAVAYGSRYTAGSVFWRTTLCTYAVGATQISDATNFTTTGGIFTDSTSGLSAGSTSETVQYHFETDSPSFQVVCSGGTAPHWMVYVDGVPLTLGLGSGGTNGGAQNFLQIVFPTRKLRRITLEPDTAPLFFYGVLCSDAISKVYPGTLPNSVRAGFVGTSYLSGSAQHPVCRQLGLGELIAKNLGLWDYIVDAAGSGTGYDTASNYLSRLATMGNYNPELVIVTGGGINDRNVGGMTQAIEQASVTTYLAALRAALPNAVIIVFGSEAGSTGPATNVFQMEAACAAGVATQQASGGANGAPDPYTFYVPQSNTTAEQAWVSGTGTTAAPNASGNSDLYIGTDGIHPVQAGVSYLAQRHAQAIIGVVNSLAP